MGGTFFDLYVNVLRTLIQTAWIWVLLVAAEMCFPRTHQISAKARLKAAALGVVTWLCAAVIGALIQAPLQRLGIKPLLSLHITPATAAETVLWTISGTIFVLLVSDFLYYLFHRIQHTRLLWRFHSIHHAIEDLTALNYAHWTEDLQRTPFVVIPSILFIPTGLSVWPLALSLMVFQSQYIHAQTRLHLGPFWRLIYDPRFHRIHHSIEPKHFDKNFGVLTPLWDWMFGTLYIPAKDEWPNTGLIDQREIDGLWDYICRPFRSDSRTSQNRYSP